MRPTDFAAQLNVSLANGWGIVRTVTDMCMKMPEGKYVLVKDPNKVRYLIHLRSPSRVYRSHFDIADTYIAAGDPPLCRSPCSLHR